MVVIEHNLLYDAEPDLDCRLVRGRDAVGDYSGHASKMLKRKVIQPIVSKET